MTAWTALVPLRRRDGKSRLGDTVAREELTRAMATDVVAAARACRYVRQVVVVVADDTDVRWLDGAWSDDDGGAPCLVEVRGQGLDQDLAAAAAVHGDEPVVVVMADLAGLTPDGLAAVLAGATDPRGVVADAGGTGTALLLARSGAGLSPSFGPGSFARHRAGGATDLTPLAGSGVRLDVDTPDDLELLRTGHVGAGPATSVVLRASTAGASGGPPEADALA